MMVDCRVLQYAHCCQILGDASYKGQLSVEFAMTFSVIRHKYIDLIHYDMIVRSEINCANCGIKIA